MKRTKKPKQKRGRFCVINHRAPNDGERTVFDSEIQAIGYAKDLIDENWIRGKHKTMMYVVEIKKVVKSGAPPISVLSPAEVKVNR